MNKNIVKKVAVEKNVKLAKKITIDGSLFYSFKLQCKISGLFLCCRTINYQNVDLQSIEINLQKVISSLIARLHIIPAFG